jgi:hypothetical protein
VYVPLFVVVLHPLKNPQSASVIAEIGKKNFDMRENIFLMCNVFLGMCGAFNINTPCALKVVFPILGN